MAAAVARESLAGREALGKGHAPFAGKYAVERVLGQGGMGTVFAARHVRLGHRVAIKVLGSELRDYPELVTRFEREARAAGALTSRHAVRVFDIDMTEDATPFIVMELLAGEDLARIVEREGPQPVGRAVRWVIEACDAIAEAHRLGIIHRDLKPSNLFLTDEGVKVLDFGIAKRVTSKEASITHAVAPLGTPQYMSPEQVRCAKDVDARTDVWSLGVTLYELLTGRTPFAHESPSACIASIAADPVPDPRELRADLPPGLAAVLMQALSKDVDARLPSVPAFVRALRRFAEVDGEEEPALEFVSKGVVRRSHADTTVPPAVSRAPAASPQGQRRRSSLALAGAAIVGLAALVVTPKCVRTEASASSERVASGPVAVTEAAEEPMPIVVEPVPVAAAVAEPEPAAAPEPAPPPKRVRAAKAKAEAPAARTVRAIGEGTTVHGGLSSPGF